MGKGLSFDLSALFVCLSVWQIPQCLHGNSWFPRLSWRLDLERGSRRWAEEPFPRCPPAAGCLCCAACSIQLNHLRSHTLSEHGSGVPRARICLAARPAPGWARSRHSGLRRLRSRLGPVGTDTHTRRKATAAPAQPSGQWLHSRSRCWGWFFPLSLSGAASGSAVSPGKRAVPPQRCGWEFLCVDPPNRSVVFWDWGNLSIREQTGARGWQNSVLCLRSDSSLLDKADGWSCAGSQEGLCSCRPESSAQGHLSHTTSAGSSSHCLGLLPAESEACV